LRQGEITVDRSRRRSLGVAALSAAAIALACAAGLAGLDASSHAAGPANTEVAAHTYASLPAREMTMIGATPMEAGAGGDETWGIGVLNASAVPLRFTTQTDWTLAPALRDAAGEPLSGFALDRNPLAGQITPHGSGALIGTTKHGAQETVLVRDPGQAFTETAPVPEGDLETGEHLYSAQRAPLIAPLDEHGAKAGALVVPYADNGAVERWVLHWSGETHEWTR